MDNETITVTEETVETGAEEQEVTAPADDEFEL